MKTFNQYLIKLGMLVLVGVYSLSTTAQQDNETEPDSIHLDTILVNTDQQALKKLVFKITSNKDFNYRKTLRASKTSHKQYVFLGKKISEVNILKHFKKAARKSENLSAFINYFSERQLCFIALLNPQTLDNLYAIFRETTFNGYLDELALIVGTTD